jgi:hypothetical protein
VTEVEPVRAKIIVDGKVIEQVGTFKYLGVKYLTRMRGLQRRNFIRSVSLWYNKEYIRYKGAQTSAVKAKQGNGRPLIET